MRHVICLFAFFVATSFSYSSKGYDLLKGHFFDKEWLGASQYSKMLSDVLESKKKSCDFLNSISKDKIAKLGLWTRRYMHTHNELSCDPSSAEVLWVKYLNGPDVTLFDLKMVLKRLDIKSYSKVILAHSTELSKVIHKIKDVSPNTKQELADLRKIKAKFIMSVKNDKN